MTDNNPLLCDPDSGVCETPISEAVNSSEAQLSEADKPVKIVYFTDPICSSCWGIEPQLRKLKLEYGKDVEIEYHMGGLLPDWSYNSGGISKPSDVAHHWDEVSEHYNMPIDGDVWLEDPLDSSYPPSIAFKAAQLQDKKKAQLFLRKIREMVFLEKKNITKWEHLAAAGTAAGLDVAQLKSDYEGPAKSLFEADLALGRMLRVRGFPTLFFVDSQNQQHILYGFKPYEAFEANILKAYPKASKSSYDTSWEGLFGTYPTLTTQEFSVLSGKSVLEREGLLRKLVDGGKLTTIATKNGLMWVKG